MAAHQYTLYSDGGARGNPGPAGAGFVLARIGADGSTETIAAVGEYLGKATNNVAEYTALLLGLKAAREQGVTELACYLDSELIVKQLKREYRVKDPTLAQLFVKVWNLALQFKKITFTHIPRAKNKSADRMVNLAIDARGSVEE